MAIWMKTMKQFEWGPIAQTEKKWRWGSFEPHRAEGFAGMKTQKTMEDYTAQFRPVEYRPDILWMLIAELRSIER